MDDYKSRKQKQKEWLKQWIKDNPEEYAKKVKEVEQEMAAEKQLVDDFKFMVGSDYFKAVSVHICPTLMCDCGIPETPAVVSPVMRRNQKCGKCNKTFSAVFYQVNRETRDQHDCNDWGIFVMTPNEYNNIKDVNNLFRQWNNKIMLAGTGISKNNKTYGHVTLNSFTPTKALFVVCAKCDKKCSQGYVTFSNNNNNYSRDNSYGDSELVCFKCDGSFENYPYLFEMIDYEVLFRVNEDFDWDGWQNSQRREIEEQYQRFSTLRDQLDFGPSNRF